MSSNQLLDDYILKPYLEENEKVIWCGRPIGRLFLEISDYISVFLTGGFALFIIYQAIEDYKFSMKYFGRSNISFMAPMFLFWIIPFVIIIFSLSIRKKNMRENLYAITERRLMCIISGKTRECFSKDLSQIKDISYKLYSNDRGTIHFDNNNISFDRSKYPIDARTSDYNQNVFAFIDIPSVKNVYSIINQIKSNLPITKDTIQDANSTVVEESVPELNIEQPPRSIPTVAYPIIILNFTANIGVIWAGLTSVFLRQALASANRDPISIVIISIFVIFGLYIFLSSIIEGIYQVCLLSNGRAVNAKVINITKISNGNYISYTVTLQYTANDGRIFTQNCKTIIDISAFSINEYKIVLYNSRNPKSSRILNVMYSRPYFDTFGILNVRVNAPLYALISILVPLFVIGAHIYYYFIK